MKNKLCFFFNLVFAGSDIKHTVHNSISASRICFNLTSFSSTKHILIILHNQPKSL